jgi:hypothetical protein
MSRGGCRPVDKKEGMRNAREKRPRPAPKNKKKSCESKKKTNGSFTTVCKLPLSFT